MRGHVKRGSIMKGLVVRGLFTHIPGQLLRMSKPARQVICDSRRQENPRPSPPPLQWSGITVVSPVFPDSTSPGPTASLLLAGTGCTQPIRMEDTHTPTIKRCKTTMRRARKVICDSPVPDLFFTYSRFYCKNVHFMKKFLKIKRQLRC